jgi:hypothetical protein
LEQPGRGARSRSELEEIADYGKRGAGRNPLAGDRRDQSPKGAEPPDVVTVRNGRIVALHAYRNRKEAAALAPLPLNPVRHSLVQARTEPPATSRTTPLTQADSSETRNKTAWATSSGVPRR